MAGMDGLEPNGPSSAQPHAQQLPALDGRDDRDGVEERDGGREGRRAEESTINLVELKLQNVLFRLIN